MSRKREKHTHAKYASWPSAKRLIALGLAGLLVIVAVGAFIAWPKSDSKPAQTAPVNFDKSKGAANAAVTVIEYGDLQ